MPAEWGAASIVYDLSGIGFQGFGGSSKDRTVAEGYAPCGSVSRNGRLRLHPESFGNSRECVGPQIANHVKFAAKAGDCCIFDLASKRSCHDRPMPFDPLAAQQTP